MINFRLKSVALAQRVWWLALALLLLSACGNGPLTATPTLVPLPPSRVTPTVAPSAEPTFTATEIVVVQAITPTATAFPTVVVTATTAVAPTKVAPRKTPRATTRPALTPNAPSGKIVFQESNGGSIYVVNANGSSLRRLTYGFDPALSPDGTLIAFTRWDEPRGVWIFDTRTNESYLLVGANGARSPTWSPDGSEVAFAFWRKTVPGRRICIGNFCFDLPPDEFNGLARARVADKTLIDLPASQVVQSPAWEPNGERVVYKGKQGLKTTWPHEENTQEFVFTTSAFQQSPAWRPDGQQLVVQTELHDHHDIFLLDRDGKTVAPLTENDPLAGRAANNVAPTWSPDGKQILFLTDRNGTWQLFVMNADGSNQRPFLPEALKNIAFRYDFAADRVVDWGR